VTDSTGVTQQESSERDEMKQFIWLLCGFSGGFGFAFFVMKERLNEFAVSFNILRDSIVDQIEAIRGYTKQVAVFVEDKAND
jgi:hypothetical protein